jgi:hypothetical protein
VCVSLLLTQLLEKRASKLPLDEWRAETAKLRKTCKVTLSLHAVPLGSSLVELYLTHVRASFPAARLIDPSAGADKHRPGTAQVEIMLPHLQGSNKRAAAVAAAKVVAGVGLALFSGSYGTLAAGVKQAAGVGLDVARQCLTRECLEQLLQLSSSIPGDVSEVLQQLHDAHFHRSTPRASWLVVQGRWEPKARFAALLAELAMALQDDSAGLRRLCLGDDTFVGLRGLVSLGLTPGGDHQLASRSEPMTRIANWATAVLSSLTDEGASQLPTSAEGLEVLTHHLTNMVDSLRAELALSAAQVLPAPIEC